MGKISDALEKRKKEKIIKTRMIYPDRPDTLPVERLPQLSIRENNEYNGIDAKLIVCSAPGSVEAENFKILRAQILFPKNQPRKRVIMVTSAFPGEGKTFVAVNLAASIAQGINEYVLLVDCDFRRPQMHKLLGCPNTQGLHEYLSGKKKLNDLILATGIEKLSLIPSGSPSNKPSELLSSLEMKEFFQEVRDRYEDRFIIVDAAPFQVTAEVSVLSNYVEAVIFVVMAGKTPREIINQSIDKIGRENILGVVFNGYEQGLKRYGKYYRGYYK